MADVMRAIERHQLDQLLGALVRRGFTLVGPRLHDGAIVYEEISSAADLPAGWTDEQDGGHYRLKRRDDDALFGYVVGPHSWKKFLHPPRLRLFRARRDGEGEPFRVEPESEEVPAYALIGVRACELAAIAIQDRVFLEGAHVDPAYKARRDKSFLVAVLCGQAGGTCFCASMGTGPRAHRGFDLALTELVEEGRHLFLIEAGSAKGEEVLAELEHREASAQEITEGEQVSARAAAQMGRELETHGLKELLAENVEHPRWDEVAARCLTCGNCTLVCPTCFCTSVEDTTDLTGNVAERFRQWDSCFTIDFSYLHGGSVRTSSASRYRQWMTHKLSTWFDQFGTSGCVGCGRCITWCPVAIDITEEARAIRKDERKAPQETRR